MANAFSNDVYRPAKSLSYITIGLLVGLIVSFSLMFVMSFVQVVFSSPDMNMTGGRGVPVAYFAVGLAAVLASLLRVFLIIFFLIWLYRAFSNLPALESRNLEFSPGWAVGWWFIPFANLVKPYRVMGELWNASDSDFDPELFLSSQVGTPSIIGWWWGLFIVGNIVGRISDALVNESLSFSLVALMIYCVLHGTAAYLILTIVRRITSEQDLRFQKLGAVNNFQPPPPPTFDGK